MDDSHSREDTIWHSLLEQKTKANGGWSSVGMGDRMMGKLQLLLEAEADNMSACLLLDTKTQVTTLQHKNEKRILVDDDAVVVVKGAAHVSQKQQVNQFPTHRVVTLALHERIHEKPMMTSLTSMMKKKKMMVKRRGGAVGRAALGGVVDVDERYSER